MAIFKRLTAAEIERDYTHHALYFGLIPIYINMRNSAAPDVAVKNGYPDFLLTVVDALVLPLETLHCAINPDHQPMFSIKLTGTIKKDAE